MKKVLAMALVVGMISGCFGPTTFDATDDETVKASSVKIANELSEEQKEDFSKAIMYFSVGGENGLMAAMAAKMTGSETASNAVSNINIQVLNGLTGPQILDKYYESLKIERLAREKREEEMKLAREKAERIRADKEKFNKLAKEASALLEKNEFQKAIAKYKEIQKIPDMSNAAAAGIERATEAMKELQEQMDYISNVEITEFVATRIDTYSDKGIPAVRIALKNNGNRSLDKVKVMVYFHDNEGETIFEEDYHPVLVSKYSYENKPLKPGYVEEMKEGRFYTLKSKLSGWESGNATAKITEIAFSKD